MPRYLDILLASFLALALLPMLICILLAVRMNSSGPGIHWSKRVGRDGVHFMMPKFRTMKIKTPNVATDLLLAPEAHITSLGRFLRRTSLDELPQLWSILIGDMSFVGPRPALFNQHELVARRQQLGIDKLKPGITGWAQINGRDEISLHEKLELDTWYLQHHCFQLDIKILITTLWRVLFQEKITH